MDLHQRAPGAPAAQPSWHWPEAAAETPGPSGAANDDIPQASSSGHDVPLRRGVWKDGPTPTSSGATFGTAAASNGGGNGVGVGEEEDEEQAYRRRFKPRTCRICLETMEPRFDVDDDAEQHHAGEEDGGAGDGLLEAVVGPAVAASLREGADRIAASTPPILKRVYQSSVVSFVLHPQHFILERFRRRGTQQDGRRPRDGGGGRRGKPPRYISEDPTNGRLFSPCRCKGSQKYVHEGCLQAWRHAAPLADRNFWTCPTCKFSYRIERLRWGRLVSGTLARATLTLIVFLFALFLLGFVADPLIALWQDPGGLAVGALFDFLGGDDNVGVVGVGGPVIQIIDLSGGSARGARVYAAPVGADDDAGSGWIQHFSKGLLSLGLVGAVRTFLVSSPITWWTVRAANGAGARNRRRGNNVSFVGWTFVLWGAFLFLRVTWKGINRVSGMVLDRASEHIVDVGGNDDDDDDDDGDVNRTEGQ